MEEEVYAPEGEETPVEVSEETGERAIEETVEVAKEEGEPTPPAEPDPKEKALLKAAQDERKKRQEIKAEMEYWRKVATGEIENPVKPAQPADKPKPDQFDDYDAYVEALADWKAEQVVRRTQEQSQQLTREQIQKREEARLLAKAAKDAEAALKRYPDFQEVAAAVNLPETSLKALYQSDAGPDIAYFLGKNPAELERILDLSPARQIMELGKLEVKLSAKAANPKTKEVKQTPTQVEGAGGGFPQQRPPLVKMREDAIKSGNWQDYLIAAGIASG